MKIAAEYKAIALFFLLLCTAAFLSPHWHSFSLNKIPIIAFSLESFDQRVEPGQQACFTVAATPRFLTIENTKSLLAQVNGQAVAVDIVGIYKERVSKEYCFSTELLQPGDNVVYIFLGTEKLFYHVSLEQEVQPASPPKLELLDLNSEVVKFSFQMENRNSFEPIQILVNGKIDHRAYPKREEQVFLERIETKPGTNNVEVRFRGISVSGETFKEEKTAMPFPAGFLIIALIVAGFALTIFSDKGFFEKFGLSIGLFFVLVIATGFALNALKALSLVSFTGVLAIASGSIAFAFRKKFRLTFKEFNPLSLHPLHYVVILIGISVPLIFPLVSFSHYSYWNVFYERQSEALAQNFAMPLFDQYSYLGRGVSFIPGYFFLNAGISWLTGLSETGLFAVLLLLGNLSFLLSVFYFGESLGFSKPKASLLFIFFWLENFIRGALVISPRHAFSLSLFLLALACLIKNRKQVLSGITLAFAAFVQAPMLLAFPVLYIIAAKKIYWREMVKTVVIAAVIFLILFLPNALSFGIVSQAETQNWGYLIDYDYYYLFLDLGPLILFFLLISLFDLVRGKARLDLYALKLLIGSVLGLLFQVYISYRWNIFNAINIGLLLAYILPEKSLQETNSSRYLAIILLIAASMMAVGIDWLAISTYSSTAYDFLSENTSSQSRILTDPLFGHDVTYISQRAVLSDLAVEYADQKKLNDTYEFLMNKDYSILCKYDIDYTMNQADMVNRKAFGNKLEERRVEFTSLNKVFSNGFLFVHQVQNCQGA